MHLALVVGAGDDLHGIMVAAPMADGLDAGAAFEQHAVPCEQGPVVQRRSEVPVEVEHHGGDAALGWFDVGVFQAKAQLVAQG